MDNKPEGEDEDKKTPSGFEKFLKKTRGPSNRPATEPVENNDDSDSKPEESKSKDKKDSKKMKRESEEEDPTEEEFDKEEDKKDKKAEKESGFQKDVQSFFMDPKGNKPKWENIGLLSLATAAFGYFLYQREEPSKEITYIEFVNQYLSQGQCQMITISEDKTSDMFKYRAQIQTLDGSNVHLVLPQVENFLYKIDGAQRQMGKSP